MVVKNSSMYLGHSKCVLDFFGLWPEESHRIKFRKFRLFLSLGMFNVFFLLQLIYVVQCWGDFNEMFEASYLILTQSSVCYKATTFLMNKKKIIELLDLIDCDTFEALTEEHKKILVDKAAKIKSLCFFNTIGTSMTCMFWNVLPLFVSEKRAFPYKIWMPVSPENSPQYELGYLTQAVSLTTSALHFVVCDNVVVELIMFGCAQLEIIMDKLKKIGNVLHTSKFNQESKKLIESHNKILIDCVKHHQMIEKFIHHVSDIFHANIFYQLSVTVAIVCVTGLRITALDNMGSKLSMVVFFVAVMIPCALYCWFGNKFTNACEDLRDSLYLCPWHDQDIKYRRVLMIAMECMKRPIILKAGHYIPLSRPTFVSILRCSYSYFTVLNRLND